MHRQGTWMVVRPQALQRTSISGRTSFSELETAFVFMLIPLENAFFSIITWISHLQDDGKSAGGSRTVIIHMLNSIIRSLPPLLGNKDGPSCPTLPYPTRPFIHPSPVPYSYYSKILQIIILLLLLSLFFLLGKTLASPACR